MKTKILVTILVGFLVVAVVSVGLLASNTDNPGRGGKPDKLKPVHATDIELVKKITIRGKPSWAQGGGKPKEEQQVATGILGEPSGSKRYAVVVGISDYPGNANDLKYSDDDAREMTSALTDVYGFHHVDTLLDLDATRSAILEAIEAIPTDADEIVFFFSGHGMSGHADDGDKEGKDEAIVAHDGDPDGRLMPIWDGELRDAFSGFSTSRIICIFDTCLAGGMAGDLEGPGRIIAMACGENGYAYESDDWENGEFTYYFVDRGMLRGEAHVEEHKYEEVTIEEAFDYAKANCVSDKPTVADEFDDDLLP